jgi:hypothetical protein
MLLPRSSNVLDEPSDYVARQRKPIAVCATHEVDAGSVSELPEDEPPPAVRARQHRGMDADCRVGAYRPTFEQGTLEGVAEVAERALVDPEAGAASAVIEHDVAAVAWLTRFHR